MPENRESHPPPHDPGPANGGPASRDDEALLAFHLDHTPLGMVQLDAQFRIERWSRQAETLFGWTQREVMGKTPFELGLIHPEDVEAIRALLNEVGKGARPVTVGKNRNIAKDGRVLHCEWYNSASFAENGSMATLFSLVQDVTPRVQAEEAARELSERLERTLESITDAFFTLDESWRVTYLNSETERLLRRSRKELIGKCAWDAFPEEAVRQFKERHEEVVATQRPVTFEAYFAPSEAWYEVRAYPANNGVAVYFHDVTERRRSQDQLRLLDACIARLDDIILITEAEPLDEPGPRIVYVNDAFERVTGYTSKEALGLTPRILQGPETNPEELARIRRALERKEPVRAELINYTKKGTPYWLEVDVVPIEDASGSVTHFAAVERDVTERVNAAEALRHREQTVSALMDNLPGLVFLIAENGRMLRWNNRVPDRLGYSDEQIGASQATDLIAPEHRARTWQRITTAFETGREDAELDVLTIAGERISHFFTARRVEFDGAPCVLGVGVDVSRQREAEQRVREQAELLDKARDAIVVHDLQHRILYWNKSAVRLFGWTAEEAVGQSLRDFPSLDQTAYDKAYQEALETGDSVVELRVLNRQGQEVITEVRWTLVRDNEGRPSRFLTITTDVTGQRQLEQQFLRAQRMESIGTLAGGIAHDLNNVLAPIIMSIDLLKHTVHDQEGLEVLDTIGKSAHRGADMVSQVLSFARGMEGRRIDLQPRHILRDLYKMVKETFPKDISVRLQAPQNLWTVSGDPTQLHQVLLNLCLNARDAMPQGGELALTAENLELNERHAAVNFDRSVGPHVVLGVEDTGAGISQSHLEKIFDPFFTTKELGKGTGLGLSTSLSIVKSHGGFIRVDSTLGVGTRFRVYLPAIAPSPAEPISPEPDDLPTGNGETILIVDDEAPIRQVAVQTLEAFGYRALAAADGSEAVALFADRKDEIQAVIVDMMMPVMDGASTIQVLRKLSPNVRIVAASGIASHQKALSASTAGKLPFLTKPFTAKTLLLALRDVLAERA